MRFLHYRQLLRGLIAASLAIAGTQADIASAGIQSTRWSQICLLNDREYDPWDAGSLYEPLDSVLEGECLLKGAAVENDLDDCIEANRFHIDRQVAFSLLHHHLPRIHCSSWIHGFRTTGQELGGFLAKQFQYGRSSRGHLVELALALGQLNDSPVIEKVVEDVVDNSLPAREVDGNLFVYVFREESDSVSNFDSCFAETVGGRPPVLEGDKQAYVSDAVAATDDSGVGHCSVPSSEVVAPSEAHGDMVIASVPSESLEHSLFEEWVSPDWNIQHWEIHTHAPRYEYTLEGFAAKPMFPPGGLIVDLTQSSLLLPKESMVPEDSMPPSKQDEELSHFATVAEVAVTEEVAVAESNELEAWLSTAWASMLSGIQERWSDLEPAAHEMSVQSTRIVSRKLKQLGMMLIQSADRLDQVSIPIGIAGRSGTQR